MNSYIESRLSFPEWANMEAYIDDLKENCEEEE